jgi:hypothetical protein
MQIPRYWSRARQTVTDLQGKPLALEAIAGSEHSAAEAAEAAGRKLLAMVHRIANGVKPGKFYEYGKGMLREELKRELKDSSGRTNGIITRNLYGTLVLNAADVMFVDIDLPEVRLWTQLTDWLSGRRGFTEKGQLQSSLDRLDAFCRNSPVWGFRVYRTFQGLRLLATHALFDPADAQAIQPMQELGCDPLYLRLCRDQKSFRARLTPKPWRCGMKTPPARFPWVDAGAEARFREWEQKYERRAAGYRVCEFVGAVGSKSMHPEVRRIVELHDEYTCKPNLAFLA